MARLIWTEPALIDLEIIAEYIALDNLYAARQFVSKVFASVERLKRYPKSGSQPHELKGLPYRQIIVPPCRVFYRISGKTIYVVFVMRGEQLFRLEDLKKREC